MIALLACVWSCTTAAPSPELFHEDVRYPGDGLQLAGELFLPEDAAEPLPGVVVLQGSGDSDRTNAWSWAIAELLAENGLVCLLTDKRGCGASEGDWNEAGFDDLAGDALAGVRFLATLPEVDPARIGLCGLSQGGWVAPIAAARSPEVGFVICVSGASVGYLEQVSLEMQNTARQAGLDEEGVQQVVAMNHAVLRYLVEGDWAAYARAREAGLDTPARPVVAGFPDRPDHPRWSFIRRVAFFDPMPYWAAVSQPALVLYGERDQEDNVPVQESVRRLEHAFSVTRKRNARIVVVPGAGHSFLTPERRLMDGFVGELEAWLAREIR